MRPREDLRVVKTRIAVREAMVKLLGVKKLTEISVTELCAAAGIDRSTFYRNYRTVADVTPELEDELISEFSDVMRAGKNISDLRAVIHDVSKTLYERREKFKGIMSKNPELFLGGRLREVLKRIFLAEIRSKSGAKSESLIDAAAEFCVSGLLSLYARWFEDGCGGSLGAVTAAAVKISVGGIAALGREL